ncbi:MarR family winged helix-turn-helix transcriptional regulator [Nonomuraea sp. NPDC050536]|uniref:MarR family winged helix-turn-helix transcriptional regulator n=1 Tax=Nonomuraea sp. NPDC050536 TaxID=3364366 RepID=UPI0037C8B9EC
MEDSVDRHLARWRGKAPYDEQVEAIVTRMQMLVKHLRAAKEASVAGAGLQYFEYDTLHRLVAHGGSATPTELAEELMLSPAGMTGRLDTLESSGLVRRVRSTTDRRRVDIEITDKGHDLWTEAMSFQGDVETALISTLPPEDQTTLNTLLKHLLTQAESHPPTPH